MHLVVLHQSCHGWGSALVNALMVVCYNSSISTGVKLETTDVKPAMNVVMHQRHKTLMCSVSNERSSPNSAISLKVLWQPRRRQWQKRHLKSKLVCVQFVKSCYFRLILRLWTISKFRIRNRFCFDHFCHKRGSQWGGSFYGYRLKFRLFYGYRLIFSSYG